MKQIDTISVKELQTLSENMYGSMVKAVVDIDKKIMVVDAEMHVDEEQYLLEHGSQQDMSRDVENTVIQDQIKDLVNGVVTK
jgi:hypothetical protein